MKNKLLYSGKAKSLYSTDNAKELIMEFRDDTSAFDGVKTEKLAQKGEVNNRFNAFIMETLAQAGISNHFVKRLSETDSLVRHLEMIPVECVIRNIATGSLCKRLGVTDGITLTPPTFEFFLKDDALHDPMINDSHIIAFDWASTTEIDAMRKMTYEVNQVLSPLFAEAGLILVDYKLEFGRGDKGELILGDEFTPDGCRIWDAKTREKLDKDRFRRDLGGVVEAYQEVAQRLGVLSTT